MKQCYNNTKHNFKPLSDPYVKYLPETDDKDARGGNYRSRKELNPGVSYSTLYCPGCGTVVEVISVNSSSKELHNVAKETETNSQNSDTAPESIPTGSNIDTTPITQTTPRVA